MQHTSKQRRKMLKALLGSVICIPVFTGALSVASNSARRYPSHKLRVYLETLYGVAFNQFMWTNDFKISKPVVFEHYRYLPGAGAHTIRIRADMPDINEIALYTDNASDKDQLVLAQTRFYAGVVPQVTLRFAMMQSADVYVVAKSTSGTYYIHSFLARISYGSLGAG